ncbi:MAG: YfhO family protein, partial [Bacteroidales bacterium]|nr:YfhO family protein [Bacteroidales bacterium]
AWGVDLRDYHEKTGEYAYWSNTMFSGMPANYTYSPPVFNVFNYIGKVLVLNLPGLHIGIVFLYLLGFYIFLLALGCKPWLSILGAIAYAFASYNFIIIDAGHVSKGWAMGTMAPVLGGIILCYRKKYLLGALITLVFTGMHVAYNHQQITYYLLIIIAFVALTYLVYAIKDRTLKDYFKASAILVLIGGLAVMPMLGRLIPTMDYTKETMRGGAVLQNNPDGEKEGTGLNIDYAFQWSYGKMETMTLLIPNFYGGSSHYNIGQDSESYKILRSSGQGRQFARYAPMYWGDQPFTSGPVYAGAIVCFLFLLGLFVVKGPEKWWLLAATVVSVLLSWGRHFPGLNEWLFYHLPLYSKFRTPSMTLTIAGVTMAATAVLAIKTIIEHREDKIFIQQLKTPFWISAGITGGLCLIFALFGGSMFNFTVEADAAYPEFLVSAIQLDRKAMLTSDAWRSLTFIIFGAIVIWIYMRYKIKSQYLILMLGALIFVDMWSVDKRFLNDDNFVSAKKAKSFQPTPADELILQDKDPNYRVLNLASNTFNESVTSCFHKSVGGYSPAKLRRYQDIIDYHFSKKLNISVVNMLNARYIIVPGGEGQAPRVQYNSEALGNVWFVDTVKWVESPDAEIVAMNSFNPRTTAFMDKTWQKELGNVELQPVISDTATSIVMTDYTPGHIKYSSHNLQTQLAVFSEVYYKTWSAYIDGKQVPILRANYILRALPVPAGDHEIEFKCVDNLMIKSAKISLWSSILVLLVLSGIAGLMIYQRKKNTKPRRRNCQDPR